MSATLGVYRGRRNVSFVCYCYGHNRHLHVLTHSLPTRRSSDLEVQGSGDVKYHLGTSPDRDFDGNVVHLSLTANPSHLERVEEHTSELQSLMRNSYAVFCFKQYNAAQIESTFLNNSPHPLGPVVCISPCNFPLSISICAL